MSSPSNGDARSAELILGRRPGKPTLTPDEALRAVYAARASVGSLSFGLASTLLLYLGIAGLQLTLGVVDDEFLGWLRIGIVVFLVVAAVVFVPISLARIGRARGYAVRNDHLLDDPLAAETDGT